MKLRAFMILLAFMFSLFHFSPYIVEATEGETDKAKTEVKSDSDEQKDESEDTDIEPNEISPEQPKANEDEKPDKSGDENGEETAKSGKDIPSETPEEDTEKEDQSRKTAEPKNTDESAEDEEVHQEPNTDTSLGLLSVNEYQEGDQGPHIVTLKEKLTILGFANWSSPSKYYGNITAGVVEDFQDYYGFEVTGIADKTTRDKIEEVLNPPYRDGDRGDPVVELKEKLVELGFANWSNPSQYYGSVTAGVVEDFQASYGLKVDGTAGQSTLAKIEEELTNPQYRDGDSGDHIVALKEDLTILGFANWSSPSKYYGNITAGVVEDFQDYYGFEVTGIADKTTRDKIEEVLNPPYRDGDRGDPVVELKEKLVELGFANWSNPSQYYGSVTAGVVEDFQSAHDLTVDGIAGQNTLSKIEEALTNDPYYEEGDSGDHVVTLKEDLTSLGFANWSDPTQYYGSITADVVEDFQDYYNLPVTGIADEGTRNKISEVLKPPYRNGDRGNPVVELKENLTELGFANWSNPSQYYGSVTASVVEDFQEAHGLRVDGIAREKTLVTIEEALASISYTHYDLTLSDALDIQLKATPQTDKEYDTYVSKSYINNNNEVTADVLNVRGGPGTNYWTVGQINEGTKITIIEEVSGWYKIEYTENHQWVNAKPDDVFYYLNPNNFINDSIQQFQFLDLSRPSYIAADKLDQFLRGKGTLDGMGQAFIDAARINGINDIYLVSHASLETGNGTSTLASGVPVDKNGNITRDSNGDIANTNKTATTVYNMFGIDANDSKPLRDGAKRAFEEGWTTPEKAIIGGGAFIGNRYIKDGQNTLYKMRWNPLAMDETGKFGRQYATDIGWASKQIGSMYNLYQQIGLDTLSMEIPVYR
ncbi:peptidoglycan-binding protein [Lentibacillus sp. CBA3610]|uniref:peptidoglycan-binding protein n=1 Tax=Lentibacillus sp. CBA3610 TaxID=2518176 RepID=UPI0015959AC2|nr:peptidoglycan-binding protein [Lentibacillus sp. CBA3610]QKY70421.1 hypothetical protein Len3610_13205 [Lentibacillus sp. CBA3610]